MRLCSMPPPHILPGFHSKQTQGTRWFPEDGVALLQIHILRQHSWRLKGLNSSEKKHIHLSLAPVWGCTFLQLVGREDLWIVPLPPNANETRGHVTSSQG